MVFSRKSMVIFQGYVSLTEGIRNFLLLWPLWIRTARAHPTYVSDSEIGSPPWENDEFFGIQVSPCVQVSPCRAGHSVYTPWN